MQRALVYAKTQSTLASLERTSPSRDLSSSSTTPPNEKRKKHPLRRRKFVKFFFNWVSFFTFLLLLLVSELLDSAYQQNIVASLIFWVGGQVLLSYFILVWILCYRLVLFSGFIHLDLISLYFYIFLWDNLYIKNFLCHGVLWRFPVNMWNCGICRIAGWWMCSCGEWANCNGSWIWLASSKIVNGDLLYDHFFFMTAC